jgi:hypothetical protein
VSKTTIHAERATSSQRRPVVKAGSHGQRHSNNQRPAVVNAVDSKWRPVGADKKWLAYPLRFCYSATLRPALT